MHDDTAILDAARAVFVVDRDAAMTTVADAAGVGMAALYSRYGSKEGLLRTLCGRGLARYVSEARAALDDRDDGWFERFLWRIVDADTHTLTRQLAGTFTPDEELLIMAVDANDLNERIVARAHEDGVLRVEITAPDMALAFEMLAAVRLDDEERTSQLRRRHLSLLLAGLRPGAPTGGLDDPPVTWAELGARWSA